MANARLVIGPLLRYVDESRATVWVEVDRPCEVEVLHHRVRTWGVHGHHFALVVLEGLPPGTATPYEVRLDGALVWPPQRGEPGADLPPSIIRTHGEGGDVRLAFGSCRVSGGVEPEELRRYGADALLALAEQMAEDPWQDWVDALLLVGDQVYADEPSPALARRLAQRHAEREGADADDRQQEIHDFEEYTWLYAEAWAQLPQIRWLLSCVPTAMLLDDHELRDDWNSSYDWRSHVEQQPWWGERVRGAFGSYWVYQHLGNLSPDEVATDDVYQWLLAAPDDEERSRRLDEFAEQTDAQPERARWSFSRDLGWHPTPGADGTRRARARLVALDSRCSRDLRKEHRRMLDDAEWSWVVEQTRCGAEHLLLATTLPAFMLPGFHDIEGWDEAVAAGAWGRKAARVAEALRRAVDLEHWAAFRASFAELVHLLGAVGRKDDPPRSVLLLSGDVHCSYAAQVHLPGVDPARTAVHQLVMSPFRNPLNLPIRLANRLAGARPVRALTRRLSRAAGVREPAVRWDIDAGPWFDNGVMVLELRPGSARAVVQHALVADDGRQVLQTTAVLDLTPGSTQARSSPDAAGAAPAAV